MAHDIKALLITCMDYRFIDSFYAEAQDLGIEHSYDRVALAGDIKNIVKPAQPQDAELMLRQIEISHELHHIKEVVVISHQNCGAYPELAGLSEEDELAAHRTDLLEAKRIIEERVGVAVHPYIATLHEGDHERIIDFVPVAAA